jgi:transcriptional regulator with XRE-family HTH domain
MNQANEEEMRTRFGKNIWWLRTQRRLSQEALADRAEIHRTQISLLETQQRSALISTVLSLAGGLDVPIEALCDGITYQPPRSGKAGHFVVEPLVIPGLGEVP